MDDEEAYIRAKRAMDDLSDEARIRAKRERRARKSTVVLTPKHRFLEFWNSLRRDEKPIYGSIFAGVIIIPAMFIGTFVYIFVDEYFHPTAKVELSEDFEARREARKKAASGMQPSPVRVNQLEYDMTYRKFRDSGLNHADAKTATDAVKNAVESKYAK